MMQAILQKTVNQTATPGMMHNYNTPPEYLNNEIMTSARYINPDRDRDMFTEWNKIIPKLPEHLPSNVYVGSKNIDPEPEKIWNTNLESLAYRKENNNKVLPFKDTFEQRKYYTYL